MRHFLVVGPHGEIFGLMVECFQLIIGSESAFDSQDFLSNKLGKDWYNSYYNKKNKFATKNNGDVSEENKLYYSLKKFFEDRENICK